MKNPLQKITIADKERELLYTLSLYKILQDRKQSVIIKKDATWDDVTMALLKFIYAAYLNAIQIRQMDDVTYNPDVLGFMDFVVWSESEPKAFAEQIKISFLFITGKELEVDIKKKMIQEKPLPKMSIWSRIGAKFKSFSSEK